jgi:hypothetical protein
MTSKHFEAFAREIATIADSGDAISMQRLVITVAGEINKHFDPDRFKARVKELRQEFLESGENDQPTTVPGGRVLDTTGLSEYLDGYLRAQLGEKIRPWTKLSEIIKSGIDGWGGLS